MFGMKKKEAATVETGSYGSTTKGGKGSGFLKKLGGFFKKHVKLIVVLAVIVGVVLFVRHRAAQAKKLIEEQANQPVTTQIEQQDLQKTVSVTGNLTAKETAKVTSTIGGSVTGIKVEKINYEVGDYVEAGTVVVEFDGDDYDRKINELNAQYNINSVETTYSIADLQQKIADAQRKIDEDNEWLQDKEIYYKNLKDAQEDYLNHPYDEEKKKRFESESSACATMHNVTIDGYEAKQDEVKTLQEQIVSYQNSIELAQLKQQFAENYTQADEKDKVYESKSATTVEAPISGYILTMNVEEGNNYAQGNVVFTIADTSEFVVEATVNEYDIANIKEGLPAKVKFEATGDETFDGEVTFASLASEGSISSNSQNSSSSGVASYKVKIKMDGVDDRMRVGMTAKASVVMDSVKNVLCVPYDCIQRNEDDESYFITTIDKKGNKKNITVTKGLESDYYVEIKGKGLKKGMTVEEITSDGPSTDIMDYMM
ncbi:Multidrug efflux pump subunit AcrA (membrane-fusion protein) [Pseudobutyrivibrio sp. YE44]|uniref:efflux RND transporter periplasmic adaptor subunit n=1 Tax=Pseudobutyrivibrio sp. YE44 TaxID=1520802 RepID=UPI0008800A21|nr:efflux RND transporter periplasmic adaptor subunit [Pseudobutyrivibrio sp. YE44]SDB24379.1 Multidrug efflux pump subunit AcrA (membrane-fusion protein) [Pseudobutyrivibrio sp. YE44]